VVLVRDATLDVFGHGEAHGSANHVTTVHVYPQLSPGGAADETTTNQPSAVPSARRDKPVNRHGSG
jgi:hypothetical protein